MDFRALAMGLTFAFIWSSAFTSARIIVQDAPPLLASSLRFFLSGIVAVAIARSQGQTWRLSRGQWRNTVIFGICQNALYLGLFFFAMQTVEASLAAIVASAMPLFVGLLGWLALGQRVGPLGALGLVVGLAGVFLIMGTRLSAGVDPVGLMLCVIGVIALAIATLSVRGASAGGNLLMVVAMQMFVGAVILAIAGLALEDPVIDPSWTLGLAFAYSTLVAGVLATVIWFKLVGRIGAVKAATFHFLNPFFGVVIAAVLLGEQIGVLDFVGVAVIAGAILMVQLSRQKQS